jgi:hypothetical protein
LKHNANFIRVALLGWHMMGLAEKADVTNTLAYCNMISTTAVKVLYFKPPKI